MRNKSKGNFLINVYKTTFGNSIFFMSADGHEFESVSKNRT